MNNIFKVLRFTFSFSFLKALASSYGHFVFEHVIWRKNIHHKGKLRVHPTASIRNPENIYIGNNSHININCCVWPGEDSKIYLGDNLLMGPGVSIQAANHGTKLGTPMTFQERSQRDIVIGNDCWLCSDVTITAGVNIPDGCIIAAGAVVTKSIEEPNSIVGGVPAKIIGYRKD